jgi:dsDNA-specific endonuclease/ATPase MutS2
VNFKIGDKISFLNEKGSGMITNILNDHRVLVMNEDGFEISYPVEALVALAKKSDYKMDSAMSAKWQDQKEEQEVKPPKLEVDEAWEIDLHLHELIDSFQQKSDYEKLLFQLNYFKKCMDAAISHRIKKVVFIHGVGKGTLKQEILHLLKDYDTTRHYSAPFRKYGYGALIVEIL